MAQRGARLVEPVDLDHHAVDLIGRVVPVLAVVGHVLAHAVQVGHDLVQAADRQAPLAQPLVPARLRVGRALEMPLFPWPGGCAADAGTYCVEVAAAVPGNSGRSRLSANPSLFGHHRTNMYCPGKYTPESTYRLEYAILVRSPLVPNSIL